VPRPAPGSLTLRAHPDVLADAAYIEARRSGAGLLLLDARTQEEFDGSKAEEAVARPGHIPGAVRLDWGALLEEGKFLDKGELRLLFTTAGAAPGKEIVTYCRVGSRATVLYFAARLLGYPVRLYDGSMNDWASRAERAVVGPKP
jgi:thiosulfate/3-mercaptopyruvate sulfurtransferase